MTKQEPPSSPTPQWEGWRERLVRGHYRPPGQGTQVEALTPSGPPVSRLRAPSLWSREPVPSL